MTYRGPARTAARSLASSAAGAPAARHMAPHQRLLAAIALVALIGTGCANGPTGTGTGGGGPSTEADSNEAGGGDQNAAAGAAPDPAELRELQDRLPAFATCMRENGVADFPDPGADGTIQYQGDSDRPEFRSAGEKCDDLLPPQPVPNQ